MHFGPNPATGRPRRALRALFGGLTVLMLALAPATAQTTAGSAGTNLTAQAQRQQLPIALPSLAPLVDHVSSAVVTISAQGARGGMGSLAEALPDEDDLQGLPFEDFLRRFFERRGGPEDRGRQVVGLGSGFITDPEGYIVTNNHVVEKASKITVILHDNSRHQAKVVGRDEKTDLALLKIDAKERLPFVTWGDSDQAKVGDWIVAVGNPFGLGGSVTAGIISGLGRNINEGPYDDYIQIDAPINRGNSGGPAFNLGAEVIGVNTAIYSPSGGSVGIGFAVPSNVAKNVVAQLRDKGHVTRGWLGVAIQGITPAIAKSLGLDPDRPRGALVAAVTPNSPAAKAGIKQGDVIIGAGGRPIEQVSDLPRIVAATPPGQELDVTVLRGGNETKLTASIAELSESPKQAAAPEAVPEETGSLGVQLAAITPELRREYRIPRDVEGAVVSKVAEDSAAAAAGIQRGDVIVSIGQEPVKSPQAAAEALRRSAASGNVLLLVNRRGTSQFVGLSVGPGVGSGNPR